MDRAIQVCRSIKAIVLVIPAQAMDLDRCNPVVDLFAEMEEKYPNLLDKEGSVY